MIFRYAVLALAVCTSIGPANAAPNHLAAPAAYDNVGGGVSWGQTFVSEESLILGARWYIEDPTRPNEPLVNALVGPADLVLYDATNIASPIELARTQVLDANGSLSGLSTLAFAAPVSTPVGGIFYIAIEAGDGFGTGLRSVDSSTYAGGSQAFINGGAIVEVASGRDTSFEILSAVPEPHTALLLLGAFGATLLRFRRHT